VASFQRQGYRDIAEKLHDKARFLLQTHFDDINFEVAATFGIIGMYLFMKGEINRAKFFFRNCLKHVQKSDNHYRLIILPHVSTVLAMLDDLYNLSAAVKLASDAIVKPTQDTTTFPLSASDIDRRLELVLNFMETGFRGSMPTSEFELRRLTCVMCCLGAKLQSSRSERYEEQIPVLEIANVITDLTTLTIFPMGAVWLTTAVAEAAQVQMAYFLQTGDAYLIDKLRQDVNALNLMANRGELTLLMHGDFINELNRFIEQYEIIQSMGNMSLNRILQ
jgi:hypothetical protein